MASAGRVMFGGAYRGRRVLVTGHTGFKGSWLAAWLLDLGAEVAGFAVDVPTTPANFEVLGLHERLRDYRGDVRDLDVLGAALDAFRPEVVLHLAAQALVRRSYADPVRTFGVNALGTVNVLESLRLRPWIRAAVIVTSDKCYRNLEWPWGYRETDPLGGEDPYSGSKGAAELAAYSYIHSFFLRNGAAPAVATARAGNVIGGGDWAEDRIVPDCMRSWSRGEQVVIRHPKATRPWQHVLEPLSGYLWLGSRLLDRAAGIVGESYNFGPSPTVNQPVEALIDMIREDWPAARWRVDTVDLEGRPEPRLLKLSCDKALADLGWHAVLSFPEAVRMTGGWYRRYYDQGPAGMFEFAGSQIREYAARAAERQAVWALS